MCHFIITWISNVKDVRFKPACLGQPISWRMAAMLRDSVVVAGRRAYAVTSNTANHDDREKDMVLRLAAPLACGALL